MGRGGRGGGSYGGGGRSSGSFGGSGRSSSAGRAGRGGSSFGGGSRAGSSGRTSGGRSSGSSFGGGRSGSSGGSRSSGSFGGGGFSTPARRPASRGSNVGSFGAGMLVGSMLGGRRQPPRRRNTWGAPPRNRNMGRNMGGGGLPPQGNRGCGGCMQTVVAAVVIIIVLAVVFSIFSNNNGGGGNVNQANITLSTIERTALPLNAADTSAPLFVDNLGWIGNPNQLEQGLNQFHQRTGVRPLLYITGAINGNTTPTFAEMQNYAEQQYVAIIGNNQAHLLLLFQENENGDYEMWLTVGNQALTVIDAQAQEILLDYVQLHYYGDLDESAMFALAFDQASVRIMTVHQEPSMMPLFVTIGVIIILVILFVWWRQKQKQKNLEAQQTAEILSQPLDVFDNDDMAAQLAQQYEDDDD